jgi:hypothetical protein
MQVPQNYKIKVKTKNHKNHLKKQQINSKIK